MCTVNHHWNNNNLSPNNKQSKKKKCTHKHTFRLSWGSSKAASKSLCWSKYSNNIKSTNEIYHKRTRWQLALWWNQTGTQCYKHLLNQLHQTAWKCETLPFMQWCIAPKWRIVWASGNFGTQHVSPLHILIVPTTLQGWTVEYIRQGRQSEWW